MISTKTNLQNLLTENLAGILRQGADLLSDMDDALYTRTEQSAYADGGAVGGHFRHCLEFVNEFLAGLETGRVDYDKRTRNHEIETNRTYAIQEYNETVQRLENLLLPITRKGLLVKPEDVAGESGSEDFWCASSIERELEFLQSHTIHHYALIGFKLRAFGFKLPEEFGVAPSTLRFWAEQQQQRSATK